MLLGSFPHAIDVTDSTIAAPKLVTVRLSYVGIPLNRANIIPTKLARKATVPGLL